MARETGYIQESQELPEPPVSQELPEPSVSQELPEPFVSQELPEPSVSQELPESPFTPELPESPACRCCRNLPFVRCSRNLTSIRDPEAEKDYGGVGSTSRARAATADRHPPRPSPIGSGFAAGVRTFGSQSEAAVNRCP
ncbi:uncharacterized protein LOC115108639 isoform X2 [Oncorhynchus nerka]|uniref:uncharacterized protein LOC115108639 isoform X2 n=1 Tax=Oncorhynchus nerka TaxID=8023 RepID=UPI0031B8185E